MLQQPQFEKLVAPLPPQSTQHTANVINIQINYIALRPIAVLSVALPNSLGISEPQNWQFILNLASKDRLLEKLHCFDVSMCKS